MQGQKGFSGLRTAVTALALAAGAGAAPAMAHEAGDFFVRAGVALVAPNTDSGPLVIDGSPVDGTGVDVDDAFALGLTLNYMITSHWGVELLASTPFEHDIDDEGVGLGTIAKVEHLPPTLSIQYYPLAADSPIQPYVGVGVNYWMVLDEELTGAFQGAFGPGGDLDIDDSWGLAGQLGVDVALNERWGVNAALWYIDVDTEASIVAGNGTRIGVDVDVDPWAWMVGLSYKF